MHQPRPYGLHVIGSQPTDKDESFISSVAQRITNLKSVSGVDSMKMVYDLPDGGYVIVQNMGGNFRVITHKPLIKKTGLTYDGVAGGYIPMLYSGVITKAVLFDEEEGAGLRLTHATRLRLNNYNKEVSLPSKEVSLHRFRVNYHDKFQEFATPDYSGTSTVLRTQYDKLHATWYSGAMAEVVQIVGAYGRQDFSDLPDDPIERASMLIPSDVKERIEEELLGMRLPAYSGVPNIDGQISYDYRFNKTNGIGFDTDKKPWLLQVSASGVWAMPMPVIPATTTEAFRLYVENVGDEELLAILDRFGGMPSGEDFPSGDEFQSWRRAGVIIKVCDTADFYTHATYSSACGWSFNSKGTEGYNTCYDYYDDEGLGYGLTYKLRLELRPAINHTLEPPVQVEINTDDDRRAMDYVASLRSSMNLGTHEARAILYKLRNKDSADIIYERSVSNAGASDYDFWNNLEQDPIANHRGTVREVYRGYLYHRSAFAYQPQIKFPEPLVKGCISHDFLPLENGVGKDKYPNSDTIMFAYYIGDILKVVKYFIDWGSFKRVTVSNFEPYMRAGQWRSEVSNGSTSIQGYFYSTDIDDREVISPTLTVTEIEGKDYGYDHRPKFRFDGIGFMCGTMWRNRYYTHKTNTTVSSGKTLDLAVCIPYFCRNALIQASKTRIESVTKSESLKLELVQDPNIYRFWTYDPIFANTYMTIPNPKGNPYPTEGNPVWVEQHYYSPSNANSFADNGNWVGGLPANYTWAIHPDHNKWEYSGGGTPPNILEYSDKGSPQVVTSGNVRVSIGDAPAIFNKNMPNDLYFFGSPTQYNLVFYQDACKIVFGESDYYNVSEPNDKGDRGYVGFTSLVDHKTAHNFIGVINE